MIQVKYWWGAAKCWTSWINCPSILLSPTWCVKPSWIHCMHLSVGQPPRISSTMPNLRVPNPTYIAKYVPNPPRISLKQWNYVELPLDHGIISSSSNNNWIIQLKIEDFTILSEKKQGHPPGCAPPRRSSKCTMAWRKSSDKLCTARLRWRSNHQDMGRFTRKISDLYKQENWDLPSGKLT
jgi:hypothetical protein